MFNIFKKKDNTITCEKDVLLSMFYSKDIKVNTPLLIPDGVTAYVSYRDEIYHQFTCGSYVLAFETLPKLFDKMSKGSFFKKKSDPRKLKHFAADIFFVGTSAVKTIDFTHKIKSYTFRSSERSLLHYTASLTYSVCNLNKFLAGILSETAVVSTGEAERIIYNWIVPDIKEHITLIPAHDSSLPFDAKYISSLTKELNREYASVGIAISSLSLKLKPYNTSSILPTERLEQSSPKHTSTSSRLPSITDVSQMMPRAGDRYPTLPDLPRIRDAIKYCPRCQSAIIKGAEYCHACGTKIL